MYAIVCIILSSLRSLSQNDGGLMKKDKQLIPVEEMPKTYKYIGTPEQVENQSKFKVISGKVRIIKDFKYGQ
jgi:hypothetical protein